MGWFSITPQSKKERKAYEMEKANSLKIYSAEKERARIEQIRAQARFDALPRSERAKQRLAKGFSALKTGANKLQAFDNKMEARARAQGSTGGIIQSGYKKDFGSASQSQPFIQRSLQGQQGEGLIQQSLRQQAKRR